MLLDNTDAEVHTVGRVCTLCSVLLDNTGAEVRMIGSANYVEYYVTVVRKRRKKQRARKKLL